MQKSWSPVAPKIWSPWVLLAVLLERVGNRRQSMPSLALFPGFAGARRFIGGFSISLQWWRVMVWAVGEYWGWGRGRSSRRAVWQHSTDCLALFRHRRRSSVTMLPAPTYWRNGVLSNWIDSVSVGGCSFMPNLYYTKQNITIPFPNSMIIVYLN